MQRKLKSPKELAKAAFTLAQGSGLVHHQHVTYIPVDYVTQEILVPHVPPDADRTIWLPLNPHMIMRLANQQADILFRTSADLSSFCYMVAQHANQVDEKTTTLLVRTPAGLKELAEDGQLVEVTGNFRPNTLRPMLNEDQVEKDKVFAVISGWLDDDAEAAALLRHLATCLAPGYSAVKYVLLLGEGRNGKSLLLKMLEGLFGLANISRVTRQAMSERSPVVTELNGKLLNVIYDGMAEYVKDSGTEKSLVAGEPAPIRRLYESEPTIVQSNALFIEGLNREPKTSDKSTALQKRLVRFQFPNVYPLNIGFERSMLREETLGAFLSLLIDHYVKKDEVAERLAPTVKAMQLQLTQMHTNSLGMQFLQQVVEKDPRGIGAVLDQDMADVVEQFRTWRSVDNFDVSWSAPGAEEQLAPLLVTERKSKRIDGKVVKIKQVTALKEEAAAFIESLKGEVNDDEIIEAVVADGDV